MILKKYTDDVTIHYEENGVQYIKFRVLEDYKNKINHLITLRHGGVSSFPVDSLNFRTVGKDKKENVYENLERVCQKINVESKNIFKAKQDHTDNILILDNENKNKYAFKSLSVEPYDSYIVKDKNIATLVTTADCNMVIIYDKEKNIYANIHSGWKGTIKKITKKTIIKMHEEFGTSYEDLMVCIGPSIRKCCFSSEEESFKEKFLEAFPEVDSTRYIEYEKNGKRFHIDQIYLIKKDLKELGIKEENIKVANICTKCSSKDFFSYRDVTQRNLEDYGCMATIVTLV